MQPEPSACGNNGGKAAILSFCSSHPSTSPSPRAFFHPTQSYSALTLFFTPVLTRG